MNRLNFPNLNSNISIIRKIQKGVRVRIIFILKTFETLSKRKWCFIEIGKFKDRNRVNLLT